MSIGSDWIVRCSRRPEQVRGGLLSAGLQPPPAESFGPTEIAPDAAIGEVALAIVRRQFAVLLAKEAGARLGDDLEELHEMRVACRRLRASLSLFADVLPAGVLGLRTTCAGSVWRSEPYETSMSSSSSSSTGSPPPPRQTRRRSRRSER